MNSREIYEQHEKGFLAPYAQLSSKSLGREHKENECIFRTCFQRDLARIIHSTAFRRLEYKTQVFLNHEDNHYRTRLTHSLEVSQMAKGIARILLLNEDLAQSIALAHDLGHTPFGHPGEEELDKLMKSEGGFEHNFQSYRVVTKLEVRYPHFRGLNLSYEVLEGIVKHTTTYDNPKELSKFKDVETLEAQIVNSADEIAFMNHDLDDSILSGMLTIESLKEVRLWDETLKEVLKTYPTANNEIIRCRTISSLINQLITDLQAEGKRRIRENNIKTLTDVRQRGKNIISFSDEMREKTGEVKKFLFDNVYRHPKIVKACERGRVIIKDLFKFYVNNPTFQDKRAICDHIASMTDQMAVREHQKI